jgi:hypothetical protein
MPSAIKRTTTRALITSTAIKNVVSTRNPYQSRRSNPSAAPVSSWEGQSDTNSFSNTYSDPDSEADTDIELSTGEDASLSRPSSYSDRVTGGAVLLLTPIGLRGAVLSFFLLESGLGGGAVLLPTLIALLALSIRSTCTFTAPCSAFPTPLCMLGPKTLSDFCNPCQ